MKKKIFFQFFTVTLVCVLLMFVFGLVAVELNAKSMMRERLAEETELACSLVRDKEDFTNFSKYETDDAFRVTIFDTQGNVWYESDTNAEDMDNHLQREEIQNALAGTPETVERYSETFECKMTYYAMTTTLSDNTVVILRLAIKSSQITSYVGVALPVLIAVLVVALVASVAISKVLSDKFSAKITEIGESLTSLNAGSYRPINTNSGEPELYSVLKEINELNANTHTHIRQIEAERQKLNSVLDNVSQGIIAIDKDKKIVFANKSVFSIFDGAQKAVGKEFVYLIDDLALCEKISRHLGENYASEYVYNGRDISVTIGKIEDAGLAESVSSIVIIADVTAEKAVAKQKSDFFANASHELKTPVTVMQGLSEILLEKQTLDESSKKQVARIHKESMRLSSLVSDMLKLSKLERGETSENENSEVDLRSVAEEVVSELSEEIAKKNISVEVAGNGTVEADPKKIFELLENLCSNAVNYNKESGKIFVCIEKNANVTALCVRDTGIGIAKEHIPRLCERFYRVDKSHSKKTGGTGLGLAIVKHICALYNAELSIESEVDIGTTVTVKFTK